MEAVTLQKSHGQCMVEQSPIQASLGQARLLCLLASQILFKGHQAPEVSEWLGDIDSVMLS